MELILMKNKIFMIKEGSLVLIDKPVFTTGDAYLVVNEEEKKIYVWLGSKCSVDEKGTAAVEARRIDDGKVFNGAAKIITYDEGDEAPEFLAKLENLKILDKNLAKSMLKDVKTGEFAGQADHVNALYRISSEEYNGINAMKYVQVPFEKKSLDSEDCFIADLGVDIWVWQGKDSNVKEKVKAIQYAREFDIDRAGEQRPKVFIEEADDEVFMEIFQGKLPTQDRKTVDLKVEAFDNQETAPKTKAVEAPAVEEKVPVEENPKPIVEKNGMLIQQGEGRNQCPKCGNNNHSMIREQEDRERLIYDYPPIYGKKYSCGKCGAIWRRED